MDKRTERAILNMIDKAETGWDVKRILEKYEQTQAICEAALNYNPCLVQYFNTPSEEQYLIAINFFPDMIFFSPFRTEELWCAAIKSSNYLHRNGDDAWFIEPIRLKAVQFDGRLLQYIDSPSENVCREALKTAPESIQYVDNIYLRRKLEKEQKPSLDIQIKEASNKSSDSFVKIKSYPLKQR